MNILKNNRPIIVGIFIFIGIVILLLAIFTLGGQKKTFVSTFIVNAIFDDVEGLQAGGNIWFSGVKVGTVKNISFYGNSQVQVVMSIDKDAESHIRKDAKAKIGSDGLIGNKIVVIYGGDIAKPQVEKGDFLSVENAQSTNAMMSTLQANNKNLLEITNEFKSISRKINRGTGTLGILLNDPAMAMKLMKTVDNMASTVNNFNDASVYTKDAVANLRDFSGKLNTHSSSVNSFVTDTMMYRSVKHSLVQFRNATYSIAKFSENLQKIGGHFDEKDNIIGVLLNDSLAATLLKKTLKNVETSSLKLDEDLEAVQHNFLLRGFFRKKEKAKEVQKIVQ
jgi:phospholipid/cholesterol/gamma-HCH transport system substrate-binding protein